MAVIATITLDWTDTSAGGVGNADDVLYGALYCESQDEIIPIPATAKREDETLEIVGPDQWDTTDVIHIWGAWRQADGLDASDTLYAVING